MLAVAAALALATLAALVATAHGLQTTPTGLQTGDLVLFRWDGIDALHELVSAFTHVGMVVVVRGQPYILETHRDGDARRMGCEGGGVRVYPLQPRVRTYAGAAWALTLDRTRWRVDARALYEAARDLARVPYDDDHRAHILGTCVLGRAPKPGRASMFCSEFVGELLARAGVLPKSGYDTSCLTPESFVHLRVDGRPVFSGMVALR